VYRLNALILLGSGWSFEQVAQAVIFERNHKTEFLNNKSISLIDNFPRIRIITFTFPTHFAQCRTSFRNFHGGG
jgi:hypothetical protein